MCSEIRTWKDGSDTGINSLFIENNKNQTFQPMWLQMADYKQTIATQVDTFYTRGSRNST